ncbi:helix-turn-helix domain-containing protein [Paenibacillus jiagnxiensis]|uniref:helix-turn-helix domain-containing protein n=1 Tax=Paenibacillus jiagnxiensis TaxID=3228926 RepID=UPI0033A0AC4B
MEQTLKRIGRRIRAFRKLKGLTQEQLAELVGTNFSYIGKIERGEYNVKIQTLEKIANALGVRLSALLSLSEYKGIDMSDMVIEAAALLMEQSETDQRKALEILKIMFRS